MSDGPGWMRLDEAPELPDTLPALNELNPDAPLRWWAAVGSPGQQLYGAVGGDCGSEGPYVLGVWVLPVLYEAQRGAALTKQAPRYPTFDEWTSLAHVACLAGVMLTCSYVTGSELIDPPEGRCLMMTQIMVTADSPAGRRWGLAQPGTIVGSPGGAHAGGVAHG